MKFWREALFLKKNYFYISLIKYKILILVLINCLSLSSQTLTVTNAPAIPKTDSVVIRPRYYRNEEIIYDGKRYRIHNNYLTLGGGFMASSIRSNGQKVVGADFQFHVRRQNFQTGVLMSGNEFFGNNNVELHAGYGFRRERNLLNLAAYVGHSFFTGVEGTPGVTAATFYEGFGAYICIQAVSKFIAYDIGMGGELFAEVSQKQNIFGFKIIVFFSGSYRGLKKNINPNVRAENPNMK